MNSESQPRDKKRQRKSAWRWIVPTVVALVVIVVLLLRGGEKQREVASFKARRGPLDITVLVGGNVKAVDSQEIKCEVRASYQGIKILKIVEEGYEVTQEDIRTNKVLVELDSSELQKQIVQQDIQFESAAASLTDAQQNYEIQVNQNLSDIKAAEQKVRFARMDFDKFLGDTVTSTLVAKLGIEDALAADLTNALAEAANALKGPVDPTQAVTNGPAAATNSPAAKVTPEMTPKPAAVELVEVKTSSVVVQSPADTATPPSSAPAASGPAAGGNPSGAAADNLASPGLPIDRSAVVIDFGQYASIDSLGDGEAKQKLRKFEDDLQVAKKEQGQAKASLEGTKRLFDKGFVTRIDLEKDEIAGENSRLKVQTAETARELFLKYEFSKTAEENLSKYAEAARELVRARKAAISRLAQAQAKLKSAQGQYNIQARQRKELYEQSDKCSIKATKPGLVVYGRGGDEMFYYGGEERIREGATVRERQSIITIPDMTKMSVRVKIHESYIRKIKKGQKARVTVDAFPDKELEGEVTSVGVLPDSQNMWMNPDMKVYLTTITLSGTNDWLKPGMNAKVEIKVNRLEDVLYVPMQAVSPYESKQVCYLAGSGRPERRAVETGEFNDEFIEIKNGLKEGDAVFLRPAETPSDGGEEKADAKKPTTAPAQKAPTSAKT